MHRAGWPLADADDSVDQPSGQVCIHSLAEPPFAFALMAVLHCIIESGEGHQSLTGFPESRHSPLAHPPALLLPTSQRLFVSVTAGICKLSVARFLALHVFASPLGLGGKPYSALKGTDGALYKRYIKSRSAQLSACWLVSTNHSHLSMPRAMSVKRSAVSAS